MSFYDFFLLFFFFFFKQKTAYEMRISDWSSDVCSSDLLIGDDLRRFFQAGAILPQRVHHLLRPFEAEIGAAHHQQRRDRPLRERREQQQRRQEQAQLVKQRPLGDAPDDRQLAIRGQTGEVARRDRRIVEDDTDRKRVV